MNLSTSEISTYYGEKVISSWYDFTRCATILELENGFFGVLTDKERMMIDAYGRKYEPQARWVTAEEATLSMPTSYYFDGASNTITDRSFPAENEYKTNIDWLKKRIKEVCNCWK